MELPVIANVIRASIRGTTPAGTPWVNVLHFRKSEVSTYDWAIGAIHTQLDLLYGPGSGTTQGWADTAHTSARALDATYTPLDGFTASSVIDLSNPGTDSTEAMPPDTSLVFTHRTNLRGRSFRGRTFWSSYCEDVNVGGRANSVTYLSQVSAWDAMRANLANLTDPIDFVVASYKLNSVEPVKRTTCDGVWDRQRRRRT